MKKIFMKIASIAIVAIGLAGCGQKNAVGNISKESLENNSKVKVYYEDINPKLIKESLENMVQDLNNIEITPPYIYTITNPSDPKKQYKYNKVVNSEGKKIEGMKFRLSPDKNKLIYDKSYDNMIEVYEEVETLYSYFVQLLESKEKRDRYRTSKISFDIASLDLKGGTIVTEFSSIYYPLSSEIKKQIVSGGWQMVDKKENADKEIYFELSRDYYSKELNELKRDKKGIEFSLLKSSSDFNISNNSNNGSHIVVGQSAMSAASNSNSDLTSAVIGVGVSAIFSMFGNSKKEVEKPVSFVAIKTVDKKASLSDVKIFDSVFQSSHNGEAFEKLKEDINKDINFNK
ncbi:hypothetical protein [Aliarcobacter butzleri]|uniref:hypothetical protein n=1 Tax=Aliarcobacter butzleri TaxID=28197 RepID=UPI0021B42F5A|nr:hypothetical protein [Aliarcobacter butzleri]MCT7595633.1 hypothetical protein [Aliarcobacter butzleri]MCT7600167.1 hypothetical protein [Aliarcobacter butzleri]UWY61233.1 hypothetical protein N3115_05190 [Aliarcobacter butzleri]